MLDITDHYWIVGDSTEHVYSVARNSYVPVDDAAFELWKIKGGVATPILNEAELGEVLRARSADLPSWLLALPEFIQPTPTTYTPTQLRAYAAERRYAKEVGGIELNGMSIRTDRQSQALVNGAANMAQLTSNFSTKWKTESGVFVQLNGPAIISIATAVGMHVTNCFSLEAEVSEAIEEEQVVSTADVEAYFL